MMNYDYSGVERYAKSLGLDFQIDWVADFDQQAAAFGLSQAQVDMVMQHHLLHVKRLFIPQIYMWRQRIKLALFFLFGKVKKNA